MSNIMKFTRLARRLAWFQLLVFCCVTPILFVGGTEIREPSRKFMQDAVVQETMKLPADTMIMGATIQPITLPEPPVGYAPMIKKHMLLSSSGNVKNQGCKDKPISP